MKNETSSPVPLNLKELFGDRYKIAIDESAFCKNESKRDPWYFQIPCKYGHIYPISDKYLGFWCDSRIIKTRMVREVPDIELVQDGDKEGVFRFTPEQFEKVAKYARPRRRRRLSKEHKQKLTKAGSTHRFISKNHGSEESFGRLYRALGKE